MHILIDNYSVQVIWLAVAIVFGILELMTVSLILIWFSVGAIVAMLLSFWANNICIQIIVFVIISIIMLVVANRHFIKKDKNYQYNTNLQATLKSKGYVKKSIMTNKSGLVVVDGEEWTAISVDNKPISSGVSVDVVEIKGVKLIVKESNSLK